jgi:hypothetical protein
VVQTEYEETTGVWLEVLDEAEEFKTHFEVCIGVIVFVTDRSPTKPALNFHILNPRLNKHDQIRVLLS